MAGILAAVTASATIAANTVRTVVQLVSPTNQRVRIKRISVSFDGASSNATPARTRVLRQADAGTSVGAVPVKVNPNGTETIQATARSGFSGTEPVAGDVLKDFQVPVYQGLYEATELLEAPIEMAGGTRLGVDVLTPAAAASVTCRVTVHFEE